MRRIVPMRDREELMEFSKGILLCGTAFLVWSTLHPSAMRPTEYGRWAYDIDAVIWSSIFIVLPGMVAYGCHINGDWRWSPALRLVGLILLFMAFGFLAISAAFSGGGSVVVVFGVLFFMRHLVRFIRADIRHLRHRYVT